MDFKLLTYIESENEFSRASYRGMWEMVRSFFTQRDAHLLSFNEVVGKLGVSTGVDRGVQDIPLEKIVGSAGRTCDFTRHFLPKKHDDRTKERWRNIYTLVVTGRGFPPIDVYQVGGVYFVEDGHHRVSVAMYLKWSVIQARVTEVPLDFNSEAEFYHCFVGIEDVHLRN